MIFRISLLLVVLFSFLFAACSAMAAKQNATKTLHGSVDQWGILCNAAGIKLDGANVEKVMLGSPAYYSGLRNNDKIVDCEVGDTTLKIRFERQGRQYGATVATHPSAIQTGGVLPVVRKRSNLSEMQALERLKDCDVVVFLDCSGSMADGIRSEGDMSKWNWARMHIREFNHKFSQVAHRPITLVTFNDKFEILPECNMKDLENVFAKRRPEGGTDLAEPLSVVLSERIGNLKRRPCVIAVMHDGITNNEQRVEDILRSAAHHLLSPAIHITFLQVGDDIAGADAMKNWDDTDLAAKDMVRARLFSSLKVDGLTRAIAEAIEPVATVSLPSGLNKKAPKP